jgi:SAM-dependent methyltransferase
MMAGMTGAPGEYRLYRDLAPWWPLISPPQEYAAEAAYLAGVFASAAVPVREVLDLGSGGGHVAMHLKERLALTLVDRSPEMLSVSRELNPECVHVQGDMRTARLGRVFDAVLVHDAVDYVTCEAGLRQVIETAFAHCRPGGLAIFVPDYTAESFRTDGGGHGGGGGGDAAGRQASFSQWMWDPDPADDWIQAEYEFVLRAADGSAQVVREAHRLGAFRRATWLSLLAGAGFSPEAHSGPEAQSGPEAHSGPEAQSGPEEQGGPEAGTGPDPGGQMPRNLFIGRRALRTPGIAAFSECFRLARHSLGG